MKKLLLTVIALVIGVIAAQAQPVWSEWRQTLLINCQTVHYAQAALPAYGPSAASAKITVSATPSSQPNDGGNEIVNTSLQDAHGLFHEARYMKIVAETDGATNECTISSI